GQAQARAHRLLVLEHRAGAADAYAAALLGARQPSLAKQVEEQRVRRDGHLERLAVDPQPNLHRPASAVKTRSAVIGRSRMRTPVAAATAFAMAAAVGTLASSPADLTFSPPRPLPPSSRTVRNRGTSALVGSR